jgi:hemolysin activation/secretion protein
VFAARSMLTLGLDLFGATIHDEKVPDGDFLAWLGQLQWARRFDFLDAELIARCDAQLATSPLLGLEQFAMGGRYTVRGYREKALVRDNGLVGSLELRFPVWAGRHEAILPSSPPPSWTPATRGTAREASSQIDPETLLSVGLGARWLLTNHLRAEIYWGHAIEEIDYAGPWNLQDSGLHLQLSFAFP